MMKEENFRTLLMSVSDRELWNDGQPPRLTVRNRFCRGRTMDADGKVMAWTAPRSPLGCAALLGWAAGLSMQAWWRGLGWAPLCCSWLWDCGHCGRGTPWSLGPEPEPQAPPSPPWR